VICKRIPVVKQQKIWNKERNFSFPKKEPLFIFLKNWLDIISQKKKQDPFLFGIKRSQCWNIVKALGKKNKLEIWNHWFRSQRASQIGTEYDFTENELMEWFNVIDREWAKRYSKKGEFGLRKAMQQKMPDNYRM
jgi:hypothetical protein